MERPAPDVTLDTSGTFCPVPIIETAKAVKGMGPRQVLLLIGTDPGIETDLPAWCKSTRHEFLGCEVAEGRIRGWVRTRGED